MEHNMIPPGHGELDGPGAMPRCPECSTVIDTMLAAGTRGRGREPIRGRCPTHGLVIAVYGGREAIVKVRVVEIATGADVTEQYVAARPDYDPHIDWPERFTDGPI